METSLVKGEVEFLYHTNCPNCGSSDAFAFYSDDHAHCFSCGFRQQTPQAVAKIQNPTQHPQAVANPPVLPKGSHPVTLAERRLSKATLEKYGVTLEISSAGTVLKHFYPYVNSKGDVTAVKVRVVEGKQFYSVGAIKDTGLFGKQLLTPGGRFITITEGEIDAMSVYEMTGYPAVSVKGASSAADDAKKDWEYINSFENILICFDNDKDHTTKDGKVFNPGKDAALAVAKLFKAGKVKIVNLSPYKDANDFLVAGKQKEFKEAWWKAPVFQIDGIVSGESLWENIDTGLKYSIVPYPFKQMTKKLYGLRTSEMVTFTAGVGVGKTTLLKHLAVWIKDNTPPEMKVGMLMLEETLRETGLGLMSVAAKAPLHLPGVTISAGEKKKIFKETIGSGRFFLHDHFGSTSIDNIVEKVNALATQYDCRYIILDHISIIVSDQQSGDERKALDEIATKLKTLTIAKDICLLIVCHLKRFPKNDRTAEEGGRISLSDLRGTAGIGQLSNVVLALERDLQAEDGTSTKVNIRCLKDRFGGNTGVVAELDFDYWKFSYNEVESETAKESNSFTVKGSAQ